MDRAAAELHAVIESFLLRISSGKRRQQRRMNVQNTVGKCFEEDAAQNAHKTGEHDKRRVMFFQNLNGFAIEVFPLFLP